MGQRRSLLELDPAMQEGLIQAQKIFDRLLSGPNFKGKKVLELMSKGMTLSEMMDLPREHLDALHQDAVMQFQAGNIERAREFFAFGVQLDPYDLRFTYGLAATFQKEGDIVTAARLYGYYFTMNADCVLVRLRLAECLMANKEYDVALELFEWAAEDEEAEGSTPAIRSQAAAMARRVQHFMSTTVN